MRRAGVFGAVVAVLLVPAAACASANGRLAYAGGSSQVFTLGAGGGGLRQITHDGADAAHPDWSPDGRLIAYDTGGAWLAIAAADGSGERVLDLGQSGIDPSWSPDSTRLAFTGVEYGPNGELEDTSLYVAQADGSNFMRIGPGSEPDWSPRADWIVYRSNPARTDGCAGIWRMRSDGSDNGPVAPAVRNGAACSGGGSDPSVSPDGKRVAFVSSDGRAIYATSLHGGGKRRVVRDARTKLSPVFSPDGSKIAYSASDGIWLVKVKGGKPRRIAAASGYLAWQPLPR